MALAAQALLFVLMPLTFVASAILLLRALPDQGLGGAQALTPHLPWGSLQHESAPFLAPLSGDLLNRKATQDFALARRIAPRPLHWVNPSKFKKLKWVNSNDAMTNYGFCCLCGCDANA